jgi:hypothetical protein
VTGSGTYQRGWPRPDHRGFAFAATARHTGVVIADQLVLAREERLPLPQSRLGDDE